MIVDSFHDLGPRWVALEVDVEGVGVFMLLVPFLATLETVDRVQVDRIGDKGTVRVGTKTEVAAR